MVAEPFFKEGWGYVWASARATHGFTAGKVGFQVKLLDNLDAKLDGEKGQVWTHCHYSSLSDSILIRAEYNPILLDLQHKLDNTHCNPLFKCPFVQE